MPRPAGASNKPKRALIALLDEKFPGWNPVVQMAERANNEDETPEARFQACKEVAKYVVPQLKAVEHTGAGGGDLVIVARVIPHAD